MTSAARIGHHQALARLTELRREDDVVVATMTSTMIWPGLSRHPLDICFHAPMGAASPMGLGLALGKPELGVIVLDSDGALLMNLGALVTIGGEKPAKFLHIVFENSVYDMTGGQRLPGTGTTGLAEAARAVGYAHAERATSIDAIDRAVKTMHEGKGPILLLIPTTRDFHDINFSEVANRPENVSRTGAEGFKNLAKGIKNRAA